MAQMTQTSAATFLFHSIAALVTGFGGRLRRSSVRVRDRRAIAALSERQLCDVGIDRCAALGGRPAIEVSGRLMANLMSWR